MENNKFNAAFAKAQAKFGIAKKEGKGAFGKYAELDSIVDAISEALAENGLSYTQRHIESFRPDGSYREYWETTILHESGEFRTSCIPFVVEEKGNRCQSNGTAITYARRYGLCAALGIAWGEDEDEVKPAGKPVYKAQNGEFKSNGSKPTDKQIETLKGMAANPQTSDFVIDELEKLGYGSVSDIKLMAEASTLISKIYDFKKAPKPEAKGVAIETFSDLRSALNQCTEEFQERLVEGLSAKGLALNNLPVEMFGKVAARIESHLRGES